MQEMVVQHYQHNPYSPVVPDNALPPPLQRIKLFCHNVLPSAPALKRVLTKLCKMHNIQVTWQQVHAIWGQPLDVIAEGFTYSASAAAEIEQRVIDAVTDARVFFLLPNLPFFFTEAQQQQGIYRHCEQQEFVAAFVFLGPTSPTSPTGARRSPLMPPVDWAAIKQADSTRQPQDILSVSRINHR